MKLLHIISGMDPKMGGVSQAVRTMIVGLTDLGVQNEVLTLDAPGAPFLAADPFPLHALGPARGPWSYGAQLVPWLLSNLARFDAVIVHGLWLYHGYAVKKALARCRHPRQGVNQPALPKLYVMPHGMLDPYFQSAPGRKLKALRNWVYWRLIEGQLVNEADSLLFTCEEECRLARNSFHPYHPRGESVVGLGVEDPPPYTSVMQEAFRTQCPELGDDGFLLFLSRIHEKKGVDVLLKAYASHLGEAAKGRGGTLPKLVIAGPGLDTAYGREVHQLVASAPDLRTSVFFTGMLTGASKWGAFYGCDAFVLPSHQENFGIAVVEALACGKPTLVSNQVNIWQEIKFFEAGIVANDTLAGTQELLRCWASLTKEQKTIMEQQARRCFLQAFTIQSAAQRLAQALAEHPPRAYQGLPA